MAKNVVIIFELTGGKAEIKVVSRTAEGGHHMLPTQSDTSVGTNRFVEQLLELAMRKAGKQPQQVEADKAALLAEAERCRKELEEFDTEFHFPDGVAVEIEAYEYENACAGLMNRIREALDKTGVRPTEVERLVVLAPELDMVLLKPWFIRNYDASIGFARTEEEWLSVNDRQLVSQLMAEVKKTEEQEKAQAEARAATENKANEQRQANEHQANERQHADQTGGQRQTAESQRGRTSGQRTQTTTEQPKPKPAPRKRPTAEPAPNAAPNQPATPSRRSPWIYIVLGCVVVWGLSVLSNRKSGASYDDEDVFESEIELQDTYDNEDESETVDVFGEDDGQEVFENSNNTGPASEEELKRRYDYVYSESNGLRKVEKNGRKGFVDSRGREVVAPIYDYIYSPSDGLYKVEKNGKKGYIRKDGTVFIPVKYDYIYSKSDGVYKVEVAGKKGFVDARTGKELCPPKYDYIHAKSNDMYKVEVGGRKGLLNARYQEIVPPKYDYIYSFSGGLAKVELNGKVGYINKEGKLVQPLE